LTSDRKNRLGKLGKRVCKLKGRKFRRPGITAMAARDYQEKKWCGIIAMPMI